MLLRTLLTVVSFWGVSITLSAQNLTPEMMIEQVHQCKVISFKVERLACFDAMFGTPIEESPVEKQLVRPEPWQRAVKSETRRDSNKGWLRNEIIDNNGEKALWFTVPSNPRIESLEEPVILMASCINNISRLEIIFPEVQQGARADVSLGAERQRWTFDEQGMVLRSGRGLSAISIVRPLLKTRQIHVRSNSNRIDDLIFETSNAKAAITELRELCRW